MTKLSVNINKIAVIRNSRGGDLPDVILAARNIERFGADGITVHPRPDGRHIRYDDVRNLKRVLTTEFNIEGNPIPSFIDLVTEVVPTQVTLVPDAADAITSNAGWDTLANREFLSEVTRRFHRHGIRVSIFVDPLPAMVAGARACGADRVELYTEGYASRYAQNPEAAVAPYVAAAEEARRQGLGLNAGHDLSLENLRYYISRIPWTDEVSIGHALICDALYYGLENTVGLYRRELKTVQRMKRLLLLAAALLADGGGLRPGGVSLPAAEPFRRAAAALERHRVRGQFDHRRLRVGRAVREPPREEPRDQRRPFGVAARAARLDHLTAHPEEALPDDRDERPGGGHARRTRSCANVARLIDRFRTGVEMDEDLRAEHPAGERRGTSRSTGAITNTRT